MRAVLNNEEETISVDSIKNDMIIMRLQTVLEPQILVKLDTNNYAWVNVRTLEVEGNNYSREACVEETLELSYPVYVFDNVHDYLDELMSQLDM